MNSWYDTLDKPPLTPPTWVFSPAWALLYTLIAISIFLFVRDTLADPPYAIYALIVVHLLANFVWTPIFFGLRQPGFALIDALLMAVTLIAMIVLFWRVNRTASVLLWPYLAWVMFAIYLNAGFFLLNRPRL